MSSTDDLWRMLDQITGMPWGAGQIAAVEQLVQRADAAEDPHLAFAARMLATNAYVYGGEPAKSFVTFSWCLTEFDREPRPYHERHAHTLFWYFKYMANALVNFPAVPLVRTYGVLDDMERRYRAGGHSVQAVHKYRHRVARHIGAADEAEEWYRQWVTAPRDQLSDCAGCDPTSQVSYLAQLGRDEEAVALAEPVLAGRLTCSEQPQAILTALMLPYLRTGRTEQARDAHRLAYRRHRRHLADLGEIGEHVEFCAVTGNDTRGLEIVERHLEWLDRAPSPAAAMRFAAAGALQLGRLATAGPAGGAAGELSVHRRAYGDRPAADVPVGVLAAELAATAKELGAQFDARNGTTEQSEQVVRWLTAEPVVDYLPLSASLRRRVSAPGTGPAPAAGPAASDPGTGDVAPARAPYDGPVPVPAEATVDELLDLAEELWRTHRPAGMAEVLAAFDDRFADTDLPARALARRSEMRAAQLFGAGDRAGSIAANREAMARYRDLGDTVLAEVVAGRLGPLLHESGSADEGMVLSRGAVEHLDRHGNARQRAAASLRLAALLSRTQAGEEALALIDRVDLAAADDPYLSVQAALHRTQLLGQLGRQEEYGPAAEHAYRVSRELGISEYLVPAAIWYAQSVDDPAERVAICDEALPVAPAEALLPLRVTRGQALLATGRPAEAVDELVEAVALCVEQDADGIDYLRFDLANAYRLAGRLGEAAEVAEEAVAGLDRAGRQADADQSRYLLAGIYRGLDEPEPALALLDQLAENLDGPDNLPGRGQMLEEAGDILYDTDRDSLAAQRFAAAAEAYRLAGLPQHELRARRREAAALLWSPDVPGALAAVGRAERVAAGLTAGEPVEPAVVWELSMLADTAARVLAQSGQLDEALDRLAGVPDKLRSIEAFGEAAQVEVFGGELLLDSGRPAQAEPVLRRVLGGLPTGSDPARRTAWLLARALDQLDRSAEADALRAEHGLTADD
ncbi:hypothetical protein AB0M79_15330 [Polymorphospora sp. NPDC051019]|uniref:hypothetical protein n=1 Tax=Polymorphospora sp. NPDC051019 TaxID=3155725 RepID=UPI00341897DD